MPTPSNNTSHERWTIGALKEYFEMRFDGLEKQLNERYTAQEKALKVASEEEGKRLDARFTSQEKAVITALVANEKRLDGMNQIRDQLEDQAATFVTRIETNAMEETINLKLDTLNESIKSIQISDATLAGKASTWQVVVAWVIGVAAILSRFIK